MVGALLYLAAVWAICRHWMENRWRRLIAIVLLTASPVIVDYYSAARGYGPALACYVWAFYALLRHRAGAAGAWMALSVLCNLTFLVPAVSAAAVYGADRLFTRASVRPLLTRFLPAFAAVAGPGLAIPLLYGKLSDFYFGVPDLEVALSTLIAPSLAHGSSASPPWISTVQWTILPALLLAVFVSSALAMRRRMLPAGLAGGTLGVSLLLLIAAHHGIGLLYPWTRTGLYLIWLFLVSLALNGEWASSLRGKARWLSVPLNGAVAVLAVMFLAQTDTRYYYEFRADAAVARMVREVKNRGSDASACIGGSWRYEPTVNYYLLRYRMDKMERMRRTATPEAGCRYFILEAADRSFADSLGLRTILDDPVSGSALAEK